MAEEWTKEQSDQITAIYGKLKGEYKEQADKYLFGGEQLPYSEAHKILTSFIKEQQGQQKEQQGGLEKKVGLTRFQSAVGLVAIALTIAALSSGMYIPPVYPV